MFRYVKGHTLYNWSVLFQDHWTLGSTVQFSCNEYSDKCDTSNEYVLDRRDLFVHTLFTLTYGQMDHLLHTILSFVV